jgi:hypothetical protein
MPHWYNDPSWRLVERHWPLCNPEIADLRRAVEAELASLQATVDALVAERFVRDFSRLTRMLCPPSSVESTMPPDLKKNWTIDVYEQVFGGARHV